MIPLKLISILLFIGTCEIFSLKTEAVNITDECIQKYPSIKINSTVKHPGLDQRSLLFIFDTTGSMQDNLEDYKIGAQEIVKDFSSRHDKKIFNYILVGFSDPDVSAPLITENATEIIEELKKVKVVPSANFDCPENALSGLKAGLDEALPNSIVYLFTDAPANDIELYENVSAIILKKQITVNCLISNSCGQRNEKYEIFSKISNLGYGLTYEVEKNNFNDILQSIKDDINSNHKILTTIKSVNNKAIRFNFDIDDTVTELKITMAGRDQSYDIKNPSHSDAQTKSKFITEGIKILIFKNPMKGNWKIEVKNDFVIISVISDLELEFGFSTDVVNDISETVLQPISGVKNILSISVLDSQKIDKLSKALLLFVSESDKHVSLNLAKQSNELYTTDPFKLPKNPFKIFLEGEDKSKNKISRVISSALFEYAGTEPEVTIKAEKLEFYERQNLKLNCNVKSLVPVDIAWTFEGKILKSSHLIQSSELTLNIQNISYDYRGTYKCVTVNQVGCETQEVRIAVLNIPKLKITSSSSRMIENSTYVLTCQIDDITKAQTIEYSWFDEDGGLLHNAANTYSIIPIAADNNKFISCQANCSDFTVDNSITLNINYAPRFTTGLTKNSITYGSKVRFDCSTTENPPKSLAAWNFTANNSTIAVVLDGRNESVMDIQEAFENSEGNYECIIGNELGNVSRSFTISLTPKESPKIVSSKETVVNETESFEIFCECKNCLPITNYSWTFNNSKNYEIKIGQNEKENYFKTFIMINNTDEFDTGVFKCQITNSLGDDKATINVKIQTAAKIEKILINETEINGNLDILEGEDVIVECIGTGQPPPKISWFKDNQKLSDDSILKITNATLSDEGEFECVSENLVRVVRKAIQLDVYFIPKRESETSPEFTVTEGNEAMIMCDLIGKPMPEISWYLNSKLIEGNDKYNISGNILNFIAEPNDSGIYKCEGINKYGSAEIEFVGTVKSYPRFLSPNDESVKVEINTQLKLSCDATGYPVPQIKFVKNNKDISYKSTLIVESVSPSDAGSYHCNAENEVDSSQKIFYVTVVQQPSISTNFNNITLYTNQTKTLSCLADGIPAPSYKWKLNNKELLSTEKIIKLDADFESGKISCIAENSEGIAERHFYLEVINIPKLHTIANELQTNITIREGDDLELLCPVENYNIIKWTLNGSPFKVPDFRQVDKKLIIYNSKKSYSGPWTCSAFQTKNATEFSYHVTVLSPPVVLASWNVNSTITDFDKNDAGIDQKVFWKGENLVLNCTVDGNPVPNVEWRKGSDLIGRGEVLSVNNLQLFHSDIYSCSAENKHGTVKKYFKVDILSAPHIDQIAKVANDVYGKSGETVTIKCPIIGHPEPLFSWYRKNELLEDDIESFFIMNSVKLDDEGTYRCLARNKYGKQNIQFDLTLNEPVQIIEAIEQEKAQKDDEFVTISCLTKGYPLPVISWVLNGRILSTTSKVKINEVFNATSDNFLYFDGNGNGISYSDPSDLNISSRIHYSKLTKLDKKSLQLDLMIKNTRENLHMKKFYCNTFNALGQDEKAVETVYYQEPYIKDEDMPKKTKLDILEHLPLQLTCKFDGYPVPEITWYKDGIQIFENETLKFINDGKILNIPDTKAWFTGNYSCVGKNEIGTTELKYDVLILSPPKLMTSSKISDDSSEEFIPENIETIEAIRGEDVPIECSVEASPKARIHWVQVSDKGRTLLDEKSSNLTIQAVEENAIYQCYANNTVGFIQKTFVLNVYYPPEFIDNKSSDENLIVKLHHKLTMECKVDGFPEPETYWTFNSKNITEFGSGRYLSSDEQVLRIINANRNSEGIFTCTSFNRFGQIQKSFNIKIDIPIQYTKWSKWSECSEFCGYNGTKFRTRTCILLDEIPSYNCTGDTLEVRKCNEFPCPINGGFSSWTDWSECPSCYDPLNSDFPKQSRSRTCDSPEPAYGGLNCVGERTQEQECDIKVCSIDGGWNHWSEWSECPTCYDSLKPEKPMHNRTRDCNSPVPAHGGLECQGDGIEEQDCDIKACPINGRWNSWTEWSECPPCYDSLKPDKPKHNRTRTCNSPVHGGLECQGDYIEEQECDLKVCSTDGGWNSWSKWSECPTCYDSMKSDKPKQNRSRTCNSPVPAHGGLECQGDDIEEQDCDINFCPIDGGWSEWQPWNVCPACYNENEGKPKQTRFRKCDSPAPQYGGSNCKGIDKVYRACNELKLCPIDGGWSKWSDWSGCTASCGRGTQYRNRYCNNPEPKYDGDKCVGLPTEKRSCEVISCDYLETIEAIQKGPQRLSYSQHSSSYQESKAKPIEVKCGRGYKPNSQNVCIDIDECNEFYYMHLCYKNEICINSVGSYRCREL